MPPAEKKNGAGGAANFEEFARPVSPEGFWRAAASLF
jgi:hypothetical protein